MERTPDLDNPQNQSAPQENFETDIFSEINRDIQEIDNIQTTSLKELLEAKNYFLGEVNRL